MLADELLAELALGRLRSWVDGDVRIGVRDVVEGDDVGSA